MQKNIIMKGLVVVVIFLFVIVSFQPIIAKDTILSEKKSDLVEVTVSTCKVDGIEDQTKFLTKQQMVYLDNIFNELKNKLKNADTEEETINIYYEAIESLDQYGLLPDNLSIEKAKELVKTIGNKYPNLIYEGVGQNSNENLLCLVTGVTTDSWIGLIPFSGIGLFTIMGFGTYSHFLGYDSYYPAYGWVYTFGLNGKINWEYTLFYGQYFRFIATLMYRSYCGGIGFTGIKYLAADTDTLFGYYFIGSALKFKLGPNYPTGLANHVSLRLKNYNANPLYNNQNIQLIKSILHLDWHLLRSLFAIYNIQFGGNCK